MESEVSQVLRTQSELSSRSPKNRNGRKLPSIMSRRRKMAANQIVTCVRHCHYVKALRHLLSVSPAAEKAFDVVVSERVRQQVSKVVHSTANSQVFVGMQSTGEFDWKDRLSAASKSMPTLYAAMSGSMPRKFVDDEKNLTYVIIVMSFDCF